MLEDLVEFKEQGRIFLEKRDLYFNWKFFVYDEEKDLKGKY